jgi:hypothetical protein
LVAQRAMLINVLLYFGLNGCDKYLLGTLYQQLVKGTTANEACIANPGVGLCR